MAIFTPKLECYFKFLQKCWWNPISILNFVVKKLQKKYWIHNYRNNNNNSKSIFYKKNQSFLLIISTQCIIIQKQTKTKLSIILIFLLYMYTSVMSPVYFLPYSSTHKTRTWFFWLMCLVWHFRLFFLFGTQIIRVYDKYFVIWPFREVFFIINVYLFRFKSCTF